MAAQRAVLAASPRCTGYFGCYPTGLFRQTLAGHAADYAALSVLSADARRRQLALLTTPNWGQLSKAVFAQPIAAGQLIYGMANFTTRQGQMDLAVSVALTYVDNGGGWSGTWAALNVYANPMYGAVAAGFNAHDNFSAGNYGDGMVNLYTAVDITALTAAGTRGTLRAGPSTVGTAANTGGAASVAARPAGVADSFVSEAANTGKGTVWRAPGSSGNAGTVRVMEPTAQYPDGYARFYNDSGQPIGLNGNPGPNSMTHIPLNRDGTYPLPKNWGG
ncbi:MAG: hypothetical protein HHJ14_07980 [Cellulomonas sp.]|uniref:hypothetical protein n=1 Tax=Cellulomonas sp. TaxID=40001 RepID=UPI0018342D31|nr:hypothetical protein [Cellulomonas sp.]NMM17067.1 hypothetical protein [Cellulomonas sp.]NMM30261.1 hypothetical protein [Cellulomonas sp.]